MFELDQYMERKRIEIDAALDQRLPAANQRPATLHEAMRYSVLAGGKRLRPILCMAAAEAIDGDMAKSLPAGLAIEILHTYTLIHDDLPSMDDDDLRRGRPTCHVRFGDATAILAGDALLTMAFEWLAEAPVPPPYSATQLVRELAQAAGSQGVIGGQVEDIAAEGETPSAELVDYIHEHKTAALIRAATRMGAIAAGAAAPDLQALSDYGTAIGVAFQIADDILNCTSDAETLGKAAGSDEARGKVTYVAVHGLEVARQRANALVDDAIAALANLPGDAEPLAALARHCVERVN